MISVHCASLFLATLLCLDFRMRKKMSRILKYTRIIKNNNNKLFFFLVQQIIICESHNYVFCKEKSIQLTECKSHAITFLKMSSKINSNIYSLLYILTYLEEQIEIEDDWVEQSEKEKERDIFLGWLCQMCRRGYTESKESESSCKLVQFKQRDAVIFGWGNGAERIVSSSEITEMLSWTSYSLTLGLSFFFFFNIIYIQMKF